MLTQFTIVDYVIILVIIGSVIMSLIRGFVREALSLATWGSAIWVTFAFSARLSDALAPYITAEPLRMGMSIILLFLVTLAVGIMLSYLITKLLSKSGLTGTDRIAGIFFGGARGILIISLVILGINLTPLADAASWKDSVLIPQFKPIVTWFSEDFSVYMQNQGKDKVEDSSEQAADKVDDTVDQYN